MTLTDGMENASQHYTVETIASMVRHQTDVYHWDFIFLGANQDAIHTAATMAIPMPQALTYRASNAGTAKLFQAAASYVQTSRSGGVPVFSREQREAALAEDDPKAPPAAKTA
jgi:hypothetical protein